MPIALDAKRTSRYVLTCDRTLPAEQQTTFLIRAIPCGENALVKDGLVVIDKDSGEMKSRSGSTELRILKVGLVGCENFKDAEGVEVKFSLYDKMVADSFIDRLAYAWRVELANAIVSLSDVSEVDRGN